MTNPPLLELFGPIAFCTHHIHSAHTPTIKTNDELWIYDIPPDA